MDARELPRSALDAGGFGNAFLNSLAVTIPATVIPITIAAFAAYAFSWMEFRGRDVLFVLVVGLLVVPLQMALIPILRLYTSGAHVGGVHDHPGPDLNGTFLGVWLAHTGFGLPLADLPACATTSASLPSSIIESAQDRRRRPLHDLLAARRAAVGARRSRRSRSSSSCGCGTTCWSRTCSSAARRRHRVLTIALAEPGRRARRELAPAHGGRVHLDGCCRSSCSSRCSATSCAASPPAR